MKSSSEWSYIANHNGISLMVHVDLIEQIQQDARVELRQKLIRIEEILSYAVANFPSDSQLSYDQTVMALNEAREGILL